MKQTVTTFYYQGEQYPLTITYKRVKNFWFRYKKEKGFFVTCPTKASEEKLYAYLPIYAEKLLKKSKKKQIKRESNPPFTETWIYEFGEKKEISFLNDKLREAYMKKKLLAYLKQTIPVYEKRMKVKLPYKVRVKKMSSRYGSNSQKTHALSFSLDLFYYKKEIIDAVIVHELAHEFQRNHQKKFYAIVYAYCPDYKTLHAKLRKRQYAG